MYRVINLNTDYEINQSFNIRRVDGKKLDLLINKDKEVYIELYEVKRWIKLKLLFYISSRKITLPKGYEEYVTNLIVEEDLKGTPTLFWKTPVKEKGNRYLIPDDPNFTIDKQGNIYKTGTNVKVKIYYPDKRLRFQYPFVTLNGKFRVLHRLLAKVFIHNTKYKEQSVVDHIDGNKSNFKLNNLRWCSPKDNCNFAYIQGLRSDSKPVLIRNIETGEIKEFESTTKACKYIGRSRYNNKHVPLRPDLYFKGTNGYYEVKYVDDTRDWSYPKLEEITKRKLDNITYYKVILPNGNVIEGNKNQVNLELFGENFLGTTEAISRRIQERIPQAEVIIYDRPYIQAKRISTGEIIEAPTVIKLLELIKDIKLSKSTVNKYIHNQKEYNGYLFRFKPREEKEWINLGSNVDCDNNRISIKVTDVVTNTTTTFNSLREAANYLNTTRNTLRKYLNNNKLFRNIYSLVK